jgi:GNAT superfamily N-acetyltransferase
VLLLLPGSASSFDRRNYPGTDYVVFIAATHPALLPELMRHVPTGRKLLFKLMDPRHQAAAAALFSLERANAFVSFTAPQGRPFVPADGVTVSGTLDSACLDIYIAMGHSREELKDHFENGQTLSFTVYEEDKPIASCFTFPNYGRIHEIAGVYTDPRHRRSGLARRVVETALHHLWHTGFLARYQVQEDNRASVLLAESIGLRYVVTYEHWRHDPAMKETV